jgi:hypothetical protein
MYKHLHALWLFKQFLIEDVDYLLDEDLRGYLIYLVMRWKFVYISDLLQ